MAHKILKSLLPTDEMVDSFQRLCNAQIEEMRIHDAHMKNVKKHPEKYHEYPHPHAGAHPDIIASIVPSGKDYNIEFEVIDDVPAPTLEEKKAKLTHDLITEAATLQEKILPARKRALREVQVSDLMKIKAENQIRKLKDEPEEKLSKKEEKFLEDHASDMDLMTEVHRHFAKAQDQIEDLTKDNIDKWKPAPFPEVKK